MSSNETNLRTSNNNNIPVDLEALRTNILNKLNDVQNLERSSAPAIDQ